VAAERLITALLQRLPEQRYRLSGCRTKRKIRSRRGTEHKILKKYGQDGTAKGDRQLSENARGVRSCQFSYFFTKPV